jgi:hypothetical protein
LRLIRVFPRKTKATPDDSLSYYDHPKTGRSAKPDLFAEADAVHISVTFTYDKARAEQLAEDWRYVAPVSVGGVAYGDRGEEFVPGRYIKHGYTFTSRGCPRKCKFCSVPLRDPKPRLLPITDGWNILDDNLLATPRPHVEAVFEMLRRQRRQIEFTGGLEAKSLKDYQVDLLASLKPRPNMFWAYDPGDTFEVMQSAARRLLAAGFTSASHRMRCYVLVGFPAHVSEDDKDDTLAAAEIRLRQMVGLGFTPMAMLYRPEDVGTEGWRPDPEWRAFQRRWARPAIIHSTTPQRVMQVTA